MPTKVADVELIWKKSVSDSAKAQRIVVEVDGDEKMNANLPPEIESVQLEVRAFSSVRYTVFTADDEGLEVASEAYSFRLGDLTPPQPATELGHRILNIRELPDEPVPPDVNPDEPVPPAPDTPEPPVNPDEPAPPIDPNLPL